MWRGKGGSSAKFWALQGAGLDADIVFAPDDAGVDADIIFVPDDAGQRDWVLTGPQAELPSSLQQGDARQTGASAEDEILKSEVSDLWGDAQETSTMNSGRRLSGIESHL